MFDFQFDDTRFFSRACTRCLECEKPVAREEICRPFTDSENEDLMFHEARYWKCDGCEGFVAVGLGAKNQVNGEIVWLERDETSKVWGTDICDYSWVKPEAARFNVWPTLDEGVFEIETREIADGDDEQFTNLPCAVAYALFFAHRLQAPSTTILLDGVALSSHEIMEIFRVSS